MLLAHAVAGGVSAFVEWHYISGFNLLRVIAFAATIECVAAVVAASAYSLLLYRVLKYFGIRRFPPSPMIVALGFAIRLVALYVAAKLGVTEWVDLTFWEFEAADFAMIALTLLGLSSVAGFFVGVGFVRALPNSALDRSGP